MADVGLSQSGAIAAGSAAVIGSDVVMSATMPDNGADPGAGREMSGPNCH